MVRRTLVPAVLLTYLVPLRTNDGADVRELASYLEGLSNAVGDVLVVDGSSPEEIARHRAAFAPTVRIMPTEHVTLMGKVGNVCTGLEHARHAKVVIADDDVRYEPEQLARVSALLEDADVVRPQNFFFPLPWHARFDTARTLLARITGGDWPGTLAVRRAPLLAAGGYAGDVLFENLELVRTVRAFGGREIVALDVLVLRRPPTTTHFFGQQIRQAYDEFARPTRLLVSLIALPTTLVLARRSRRGLACLVAAVTTSAEAGRRYAGGRRAFAASSSLLAFPWLLWRSACSWIALGAFLRGGVRYRDVRLRRPATPKRVLARRFG